MNTENVPCVDGNAKDSLIIESEVIKHLREQRHDFMNHIQVVWGYLQLKKPDEAMRYIARINEEFNVLGSLFKIGCPQLSLFLYNNIKKAYKLGVKVDLEADVEYINENFQYGYYGELYCLNVLFDEVIKRAVSLEERLLYIDTYREDGVLYIAVSNNCYDDFMEFPKDSPGNILQSIESVKQELQKYGISVWYKADDANITARVGFKDKEA